MSTTINPAIPALPDSPNNSMVSSSAPSNISPHVGGIIPDGSIGEPWTGGSNITPPAIPTHLTQHHPYKYQSSQALLTKIEAGIASKLGTTGEQSNVSFEHWMRLQYHHHVRFGMDTPFLMPNSSWSTETNLFSSYNTTWAEAKPWIRQLTITGVQHPTQGTLPVCIYDKQNLEYSCLFILGSLTPKFRSEIEHAVGLDATGVEVLLCIIECKLSLQVSLQ